VLDRLRQAATMLTPSLLPYLQFQVVSLAQDGKQVVVASIPALPHQLFMLSGGYHLRQGSYTVAMNAQDLRQRMALTGQISTEDLAVPFATLDDIDEGRFNEYLRRRNPNPEGPPDLYHLLRRSGFLASDMPGSPEAVERPTVAGLLLFGKKPQEFNPLFQARLKAARFAGNEPVNFLDQTEFTGPIPILIEEGLRFARRNTRHPLVIDPARTGSARAEQLDEYPEVALREVLTNALCHRDYFIKRPVYLKIFDNRVEVENPGGLYQRSRIEEVRGYHITRNPTLSDALHVLGFVEQFGTGLYRIERTMSEVGLPVPQYNYRIDSFQITLFGPGSVEQLAEVVSPTELRGETAEEQELRWLVNQVGGEHKPTTRRRQARATLYIRQYGAVSRGQYAELNEVSTSTARDELRELVALGILEQVGTFRTSVYRLTDYKPRT
jgi:ATP-dependent DNA helicase RecG